MKAAVIHEFGPPEVLRLEEIPNPSPGPGEVLIRVRAVRVGGLLDIGTRAGRNHFAQIDFPHLLGSDLAGEVVEVGAGAGDLRPGDRVAAIPYVACGTCRFCLRGREDACLSALFIGVHLPGSYAELCVVPARVVSRIPDGVTYESAAAMCLSGPVAWTQLTLAGVQPGDWVLVTAAASGLGAVTAQVAQQLGARVIAASRKDWKLDLLKGIGIEHVLNIESEHFAARVAELTGGAGVDIAVDNISAADMFERVAGVLAKLGTIVSSGALVAERVPLELRRLYTNSQRVLGIRTLVYAAIPEFWTLAEHGIQPLVDSVFSLDDVALAHHHVEAEKNVGRVLLSI